MSDFDKVRAILDAATPGPWETFGGYDAFRTIATTADHTSQWSVGLSDDGSVPGFMRDPEFDARAIVVARNLAPELLAVTEAAGATSDELAQLLDPENAPAAHGTWHPARRAMGEGSVELIDDDGCSLWVDPWEVAALVNGAVRSCAALDALHAKMKETLT